MTSIKLIINGATARAEVDGPLTSGMVGIPVTIEYDSTWDGLTKNLVCRSGQWYGPAGGETRTILSVGNTATVAHEVMIAENHLYLGVEGYNADGTLVIPTKWAECGRIFPGANADADPSADPSLPVYAQLQAQIDDLKENGSNSTQNANGSTGITDTARALLISILRNAVFTSDQSASITALNTELANNSSGDNSGGSSEDDTGSDNTGGDSEATAYVVVNNLENVETSNTAASVNSGSTYVAMLTPVGEYSLSSVTVTMGGVDITATAWDAATATITVAAVTGDIIITAVGKIAQTETLELVYGSSYPNVTTFEYTEIAYAGVYVIAKQGAIQGGVVSVDFDPTVYCGFNLNFYVFDADGNPYCQSDDTHSGSNVKYDFGENDFPGWEDVGAGSGFGNVYAPFSVQMPVGCTFIACMRRGNEITVQPEDATNTKFVEWACTGGITLTVTK